MSSSPNQKIMLSTSPAPERFSPARVGKSLANEKVAQAFSSHWRRELMEDPSTIPLWDRLQEIYPDQDVRIVNEKLKELLGREKLPKETRIRMAKWILGAKFNTDILFSILQFSDKTFDQLGGDKKHIFLRKLLELPLADINTSASLIAQTFRAFAPADSPQGHKAELAAGVCRDIDLGITAGDFCIAVTEIWSVKKQIAALKEALKPLEESEKEQVEKKVKELTTQIELITGVDLSPGLSEDSPASPEEISLAKPQTTSDAAEANDEPFQLSQEHKVADDNVATDNTEGEGVIAGSVEEISLDFPDAPTDLPGGQKADLPSDIARVSTLSSLRHLSKKSSKVVGIFKPDNFAKLQQLLLLTVRLHPEKNQAIRASLAGALKHYESVAAKAKGQIWRGGAVMAVEVISRVLKPHSEAFSVLTKLAWRIYNMKRPFADIKRIGADLIDFKNKKDLAARNFSWIKASEGATSSLAESIRKVRKVYWSSRSRRVGVDTAMKSVSLITSTLGITFMILKILSLFGVIAVGAGTLAAGGYVTLALGGAVLLVKLISFVYEHRQEIAVLARRMGNSFKLATSHLLQRLFDADESKNIKYYKSRIKDLNRKYDQHHVAKKVSGVTRDMFKELRQAMVGCLDTNNQGLSIEKARNIITAITGKTDAVFLDQLKAGLRYSNQITNEEIADRAIASILTQISINPIRIHAPQEDD